MVSPFAGSVLTVVVIAVPRFPEEYTSLPPVLPMSTQ
jgi:hypothetical protein